MDKTNIADQIMSIINQMAEKLGVAVEKVYPVLIKQAYVEGVISFIWILIGLSLMWCGFYLVRRLWKIDKHLNDDTFGFSIVIGIIGIIVGLSMVCANIKDMITAFMNPDWYVFNTLLKDLIK